MRASARWLATLLAMVAAPSAIAEPTGYAASFSALYRVDLSTGQATRLPSYGRFGNNALTDIEGLARLPDGSLVGVSDGAKAVFRLDPQTGAASFLANLPFAPADRLDVGLTAACDGRVYMSSDEQRKLWELDVASGSLRVVGDLPAKISGLAFRHGALYGLGIGSGAALYRIDPSDARGTQIGPIAHDRVIQDAGLDFDASGRLWATLDYNPPASGSQVDYSDLVELDPATGQVLRAYRVGVPTGDDLEGLAVDPPVCGQQPGGNADPVVVPALNHAGAAVLGMLVALAGLLGFARLRR